jgi:hypothetical protein
VKEIVIDFRRYKDLGFSVREAIAIARTRRRTRVALKRYDELVTRCGAPAAGSEVVVVVRHQHGFLPPGRGAFPALAALAGCGGLENSGRQRRSQHAPLLAAPRRSTGATGAAAFNFEGGHMDFLRRLGAGWLLILRALAIYAAAIVCVPIILAAFGVFFILIWPALILSDVRR